MIYVVITLLVLGLLFCIYVITNLLSQIKTLEESVSKSAKLEQDVELYYEVLLGIFSEAYADILRVDKRGSFSSDDEVGWSFNLLKNTIADVTEKLKNLKRQDGD